jgi:hypothetical protein
MGTRDLPHDTLAPGASSRHLPLLATFTFAIFLSAALLFAMQPMFTKLVLPRLGGAPAVWSVAMVFFQAALLAGYGYAHLLTRYAPGRRSVVIHVASMVAACLWLPLSIAPGWSRPGETGEAFWLLGLFAVSIGPPFFALAANAPLLQAWFARSDHPSAHDPYFLYAASNVGSFLALLSYPTLVEPFTRLGDQTRLWALGFIILILLIAVCGALVWRAGDRMPDAPLPDTEAAASPTWRDAAIWVALAAVPSGLLVAVTAHISTDVAAVPLLWVVPLALYLLTFVIVFQRRPVIPHWLVVQTQPVFVFVLLVTTLFVSFDEILVVITVHLIVFFVCTLMCHGELARRRPPARDLTSFYMWMSFGGMVGGILTSLAAPYAFNWVMEYPILIALAVLARWLMPLPATKGERTVRYGLAALSVLITIFWNYQLGAAMAVAALFLRIPAIPAVLVAGLLMQGTFLAERSGQAAYLRSFFGVHQISESNRGQFRVLSHGATVHGVQRIRDHNGRPEFGRPEPLAYYFFTSPMGELIKAVRARAGGAIRYGVVGLGTGALACHAWPSDTVDYFEIDPVIVRIARDPARFTFLEWCGQRTTVTLGDARLTLADVPDETYDVLIVDAFSGDAIPVHLLTREAMAIYLQKLRPGGLIGLHLSNRNLELASVAVGLAASHGLVTLVTESADDEQSMRLGSTVAVIARKPEDFGTLAQSKDWELRQPNPSQRVWTDDYSNIVGAMMRKWGG